MSVLRVAGALVSEQEPNLSAIALVRRSRPIYWAVKSIPWLITTLLACLSLALVGCGATTAGHPCHVKNIVIAGHREKELRCQPNGPKYDLTSSIKIEPGAQSMPYHLAVFKKSGRQVLVYGYPSMKAELAQERHFLATQVRFALLEHP